MEALRSGLRDESQYEIGQIIFEKCKRLYGDADKPSPKDIAEGKEFYKFLVDLQGSDFIGSDTAIVVYGQPCTIAGAIDMIPDKMQWALGLACSEAKRDKIDFLMVRATDKGKWCRYLVPKYDVTGWFTLLRFLFRTVLPHLTNLFICASVLIEDDVASEFKDRSYAKLAFAICNRMIHLFSLVLPNLNYLKDEVDQLKSEKEEFDKKSNSKTILRKNQKLKRLN